MFRLWPNMTDPQREPAMPAREWALWLRQLKEQSGASYADIARSIDEDERLVKKWMPETGDPVMPRGEAMLKLLDFFGVTLSPPPPNTAPISLLGDLRKIHTEAADLRVIAGSNQGRLESLERQLDVGQQKTAESLAKLALAIDELSDLLRGQEPGSQGKRKARP